MERCCGTCEWSISPLDEEEILRENPESETRAGDCCLNINHIGNYLCNAYSYKTSIISDIEDEIIYSNRHQIIYGYDGDARQEVLEHIKSNNQCKINDKKPTAILIEELNLKNTRKKVKDIKKIKLITMEYLNFSIAYNILKQIQLFLDKNQINKLIKKINELYSNENLENYDSVLREIKESKEEYYKAYINEENPNIKELKIQFMDICLLVSEIKKIINNDAYFVLLFDNQKEYPLILKQAIMSYISTRCNRDIAIKVATEYLKWNINYDISGNLVEQMHDYEIIELDENLEKQLKLKN